MTVRTYEELGREADHAIRATARARQSIIDMGSPEAAAARVVVTIAGADWNNGLLFLQPELEAIIRRRISELLPEALSAMQAATAEKTNALRRMFEERGDAYVDAGPQVPRQDLELRSDFASFANGPGHLPGDTTAGDARAAGPAAASGPGGSLVPPVDNGEGLGQVPLAEAQPPSQPSTSALQRDPGTGLTKPQMETLEWIIANPGGNLGSTGDVQVLVTRKLVTRSGTGPRATYTATTAGKSLAAPE